MTAALQYLLEIEWSMGNGQCPECHGIHEGWLGFPGSRTPDTLGHKPTCKLALAISELGGKPLFLGESKLAIPCIRLTPVFNDRKPSP